MKYYYFDTAHLIVDALTPWNSHAAVAVIQEILFISWKPPLLKFVKVNFDCSIRDGIGGVGFVICGSDTKLLAIGGSHIFEPFISRVELHNAWASIICARK